MRIARPLEMAGNERKLSEELVDNSREKHVGEETIACKASNSGQDASAERE